MFSVIVASGLIALVDDCIKHRIHPKPKRQLVIPVPKLRVDVDYVGTKELLRGLLHRSDDQPSRPPSRHVTYDL